MSAIVEPPRQRAVQYPESDGQPMAENTVQYQWIVTLKEGIEAAYADRPDVFVAADLFWYPVEGDNKTRAAPDVMVALGRPKGPRGSYLQWEEDGVAPQVVFEVLSPGNTPSEMVRKFQFYQKYGVQEYYTYDPNEDELVGWVRQGGELCEVARMNGWTSPLLGTRFDLDESPMRVYTPSGRRFLTFQELRQVNEEVERRAREAEQRAIEAEQRAETAEQRAETAERLAERLVQRLRGLGVEPFGNGAESEVSGTGP